MYKTNFNNFSFNFKELKINLSSLSEQDKCSFLQSIHKDYDAFISNNQDGLNKEMLEKENSLKANLEELIEFYIKFSEKNNREPTKQEANLTHPHPVTLSHEDEAKSQKKHLKKKKKSSSDKKLDANNNNDEFVESDVFEFENFDEKSHDLNKKYISNFDENNSSSQSSQSTDEEESERDKTKKTSESVVLKKRNTNIEPIGI